jgi:hypothetical protein
MNASEDGDVDELIAKALPDRVPPMATARLRSQLAGFRARVATARPPSRVTAFWIRPVYWGLGITVAAAVAAATVVGLVLRAQTSFAEVAAVALKQPWIHAQQTNADGTTTEAWYSASQAISVLRRPDSIEYRDYRLQVYYSYDFKEQVLYRSPDFTRSPSNYYESMATGITVLVQQERALDKPLEHLDFLGYKRDKDNVKLLDQEMKKVTEDGHVWLDYRMKVSAPELTEPARLLFRADATTKLPRLYRFEGRWNGKPAVAETRFDYPEKGPADVYDVGVPKTAKFVDRVPTGDLERISEALAAGRERMDNYRAVFVMHLDGADSKWWADLPMIMYRKGDKFRTDNVSGWSGDLMPAKRPAEGDDLGKWWRERIKFFRFYPQYVMRGSMLYTSKKENVTDSDGSEHAEIVSVHKSDYNTKPGESFPADYSMRPEFACRPPLGIGDQHMQPDLNLNPTEGPSGCILLTVQHTSREGRINEKGFGLPDEQRFWLDPKRDYIVMRWDMVTRDDAGKEEIFESDTVEEVAKSPGGIWYATRIRRSSPPNDKLNGKKMDQVYHLYVNFDSDLPDAFFDPPAPGRLH